MIIINASFTLEKEPTRILREKTQLGGSFNPSEKTFVTFPKIGKFKQTNSWNRHLVPRDPRSPCQMMSKG